MKRIILTISIFVVGLFLTGCGEKTLTCTNKTASVEATDKVTVTFKEDLAVKLVQDVEMKIPSGQNKDDYYSSKIGATENYYNGKAGITFKAIKNDTVVGAKITVDVNKINNTDKAMFFSDDNDLSFEAVKAKYTNLGYTCN